MKINNLLALVMYAVGAFTLAVILLFSGSDIVEATPYALHQPTPAVTMLNQQEQQEVQRLRLELEMRDRVQEEVDRAFSRTTSLLNILLFLLIVFSLVTAAAVWLLSRSVMKQITSSEQNQLQQIGDKLAERLAAEVAAVFKEQNDDFNQQIPFKSDIINQLLMPTISETQNALAELKQKIDICLEEVERLRYEQYYEMQSSEQEVKPLCSEQDHQTSEVISDVQSDIVAENETSEAVAQEEFFNANDYLNQGEAHFAKGRYLEATQSYNAAVKIDPNLAEARYQNARSYAMQYRVNLAIGNLQWAIDIDDNYKEMAKTDSAFAVIRAEEQFKKLIYG